VWVGVPTNLCSVLKEYARIQGGGRYAYEVDLKKGKIKAGTALDGRSHMAQYGQDTVAP